MITSECQTATNPAQTFWENTAETRWGNYITRIERQALLAAHSAFAQPGNGLEIGCEGGRWTRMLSELGWQMTATDIDPRALQVCQERNPSVRCILVQPDDEQLPAATASVDLLLRLEVPPLDNCAWFHSETARVLKRGGKLVGTLNNMLSWRGAAVSLKSKLLHRTHFYSVTFPALQKRLIEHGFSMDTANGCCWPPFGRHSNSRLVPMATALERTLGLRRLPSISPWVVYTATRQ